VNHPRHPAAFPRKPAAAFTLVELITAASLMTVMMLGVVEIFGTVTTAATKAEAQNFAYQQLRSCLDALNQDLRGLTHEGYLAFRGASLTESSDWSTFTWSPANFRTSGVPTATDYAFYSLGFVSVGQWVGTWNTSANANAAELLYTNSVFTNPDLSAPNGRLNIEGRCLDPRRGILGRGVWLLNGQAPGSGSPQERDYWASSSCFLAQLITTSTLRPVTSSSDTLSDWSNLQIWPWLAASKTVDGGTDKIAGLSRVMASCVSEFRVDRWLPYNTYWTATSYTYLSTGNYSPWPTALRITIAAHDPKSSEPKPANQNRFQGYVLQEVYYLGDR